MTEKLYDLAGNEVAPPTQKKKKKLKNCPIKGTLLNATINMWIKFYGQVK